tara:strand:- start:756 stop:1049 length:294 start_codon:yes stop_codon:yes gene_type:complete
MPIANVSIGREYYFGHYLHDYMIHMINYDIVDCVIELNKGVKIFLTKTTTVPDRRGVIHDYYNLHAGRGNKFTIKEGSRRVNWKETDKLGIYQRRSD